MNNQTTKIIRDGVDLLEFKLELARLQTNQIIDEVSNVA